MSNHVTPQTAIHLKQAGFKQPEQKPGQFWYLQNRLYIIVAILTDTQGKTAMLYEVCEENRDPNPLPVRLPFSDVFVYAPSAPDILWEMGINYSMTMDEVGVICTGNEIIPIGHPAGLVNVVPIQASHENPSEACAEAWKAKQKHP